MSVTRRGGRVDPAPAGPPGLPPLLPARARRALPLVTVATIAWVGGLGVLVAGQRGPVGPDRSVDTRISSLDRHFDGMAKAVASMGEASHFAVVVVTVLAICAALRATRAAAAFLVSVAVNLVAVEVIKELVRRREVIPDYQIVAGYTFPSGHVATAAVIATVAILVCRRDGPAGRHLSRPARIAITVLAGLLVIGVSACMIMLRDHFFTDTIAAVPLGVTITLLAAAAADEWGHRHPSPWWR